MIAALTVCPSECLSGGADSAATPAASCHESAPVDSAGAEHPQGSCCVLAGGPVRAGLSVTASATVFSAVLAARLDDHVLRLLAAWMRPLAPPGDRPAPFLERSPILLI